MLNIEKLADSILKIISVPINKLADRLKNIEKKQEIFEPMLLDINKYVGLLENFSKHIEVVHLFEKTGYLKEEDYQKLKNLIHQTKEEIEKKLLDEDEILDRVNKLFNPNFDEIRKLIKDFPVPVIPQIDYERLKPPELPDIDKMIEDAVTLKLASLPKSPSIEDFKLAMETMAEKLIASIPKPVEVELPELPDVEKLVGDAIVNLPKSLSAEEIRSIIKEEIKKIELPQAPELPDIDAMVNEAVAKEVSELPKAPNMTDITTVIEGIVEAEVKKIELPQAPELPDIEGMIALGVATEVGALPKPKDGNSITVDDVKPFIEETLAKMVAAIPPAKDGVGVAGALIDREGQLVATLSNGTAIKLGPVVGKDVDMAVVERMVAEKLAALPKPKDGVDGLGFDDMTEEYDGRIVTRTYKNGDRSKVFKHKHTNMIYVGVYDEKKETPYDVGDVVTWGGSMWHCDKETNTKPGELNDNWTLAVKHGRNANPIAKLPPKPGPVKV